MENPPVLYNESMDYLFPDYYRKFHCAGGGCPLTCCGGWQISIDPASLDRYRKTKGPLGARLQNEIDWREGCFRQYGGKCALLSEEGLCDLYSEGGGRKAFCTACRDFPRHLEEFKGVREVSLSLSCPIAAGLILSEKPVRFLKKRTKKRERFPFPFDRRLYQKLSGRRDRMIRRLQDRSLPVRARIEGLFPALKVPQGITPPSPPEEEMFSVLERLTPVCADWRPFLQKAKRVLKGLTSGERENFRAFWPDYKTEQLLIYFLWVYYCSAVYDKKPGEKLAFSLGCTYMIRTLAMAEWAGGEANLLAPSRFSREIEHSDQNLLRLQALLSDQKKFGPEIFRAMLHTL